MTVPMRCAHCNKAYPWESDYWPGGKSWAQCWHCWTAQRAEDQAADLASTRDAAVACVFAALAVGFGLGVWLV